MTLLSQDLVSVIRIREGPYYRGFFLKENVCETFFRDTRSCPY